MNPTDAILLFVLVLAALRGASRGFVAEAFGLIAIAAGLAGGAMLAPALAARLTEQLEMQSPVGEAVAFTGGFFAVYLPLLLAGLVAGRFWRKGLAGVLNRSGGLVVGALKWALVLALGLLALDASGYDDVLPGREESRLAAALGEALKLPLRIDAGRGDGAEG